MKKSKLISILTLLILIIQMISPLVYAAENEILNQEVANEEEASKQLEENIENNEVEEETPMSQEEKIEEPKNEQTAVESATIEAQSQEEIKQEVEFPNTALKTYFLENYDIDKDGMITEDDMAQMTELEIGYMEELNWGEEISIHFLEKCSSLTILKLSYYHYQELEVLQNLSNLKSFTIDCYHMDEAAYSEIVKLTQLEKLVFERTSEYENFSIADLPKQLKELSIQSSYITDITNISEFPNLETLEISSGRITDITPLKDNTSIQKLNLYGNKIKDISVLATMPNLTYLNIAYNQIEDLSILESMHQLEGEDAINQNIYRNDILVPVGQTIQIDMPKTIRDCFDANHAFHVDNIHIDKYANYTPDEVTNATLSEDGSKLTIDTTNLPLGEKREVLTILGNGRLSGTSIILNYRVVTQTEEKKEVIFESEELKQHLLQRYDVDKDNKITEFDMAQITELDLNYVGQTEEKKMSLTGLETCCNLEKLSIVADEWQDLEVLQSLPKLKSLTMVCMGMEEEGYAPISQLNQLEILTLNSHCIPSCLTLDRLPKKVKELSLNDFNILDIANIEMFTELEKLSITMPNYQEYNWQGIENVNQLQKLTKLQITSSPLSDIQFLTNNTTIQELDIQWNEITDIRPLNTMLNLKKVILSGNQIEDLSALNNMDLIDRDYGMHQYFKKENILIPIGGKIEIDTPKTIRDCFDVNSKLYCTDIKIEYNNDVDNAQNGVSLSEDGSKITIDAANLSQDRYQERIYISGSQLQYPMNIFLDYQLVIPKDNTKEIEFGNQLLKQFFLENYDIDKDNKITEFDMAQIKELQLPDLQEENQETTDVSGESDKKKISLKGLEYATSLESFETAWQSYQDLNVLEALPKLKRLVIRLSEVSSEDYWTITRLNQLEVLSIAQLWLEEFRIEDLPKNLKELEMRYCKLEDISAIVEFTELEKLAICPIYGNEIKGIEKINELKNLTELEISQSELEDISFIRENTTVKKLNVQGNHIKEINALQDNTLIEELNIASNEIEDIAPILTMRQLNSVILYSNRIKNISLLENTTLTNESYSVYQEIVLNDITIPVGKTIEIDTCNTIKRCFEEESPFHIENIYVENSGNSDIVAATLNEDGSILTIDATNLPIGERNERIYIGGNGPLSGTAIQLNYRVVEPADNEKEIEFKSEELKQYFLENYDIDQDGIITAYDMAQIVVLYLPYNLGNYNQPIDLQGLEYCSSLEDLDIVPMAVNYSAIMNLPKLTKLRASSQITNNEDYQAIAQMSQLKSLELDGITDDKISELPMQLEELIIMNSDISTLENITRFANLVNLKISGGPHTSILQLEKINQLTKLKQLTLSRGLEDISFLTNNSTTETLDLSGNEIKDIKPILSMPNLKKLNISYNNIENLDLLENMASFIEIEHHRQDIELTLPMIYRGENTQIDLPGTIKACFDENSKFYVPDATLNYPEGYDDKAMQISQDKTKLIIDATNETIGQKTAYAYVGNSGISISANYRVLEKADNTKKIEFGSPELEAYLQNNYDIDKDGKITAFDMAQIQELNLSSIGLTTTKGLEYAVHLAKLNLYVAYRNNDDSIQYDFSQLTKLPELTELRLTGEAYQVAELSKLSNLQSLEMNLNYGEEIGEKQLDQIKTLTNLTALKLENGNLRNLDKLKSLSNLETLDIYMNGEELENLDAIRNFVHLKSLRINRYSSSEQAKSIDYLFLRKLVNLETLEITDRVTTSIDAINLATMENLIYLTLNIKELTNVNQLGNLSNLQRIGLDACKINNIEFVRRLTKLSSIYMRHNFITDLSPLEGSYAWPMDFTNNPVGSIEQQSEIIKGYIREHRLTITESGLMENVTFEQKEFEQQLLNYSYDYNKDGKLSKYELAQISYLYLDNSMIENVEYMTNLTSITFNSMRLTKEKQKKLIEQINKLNENIEIRFSGITIELGNKLPEEKEININEATPLFVEMQRPESKLYKPNLTLQEQYDEENVAELRDGKIILNKEIIGNVDYSVSIHSNGQETMYLYYHWNNIVRGDTSKQIAIEDTILRDFLLNHHDIDGDRKITENDILNLTMLEIPELGITSLKGLEYAKNLRYLYAYKNKIKDISPIVQIGQVGYYEFGENEITDITCIANSKLNKPIELGLQGNYIDLSPNSKNLQALKANYAKGGIDETSYTMNYFICSQKIGIPGENNKEVMLDWKIKQKLIQYGIDTNQDGKLTRKELYEANQVYDDIIDLSGLGLTNISGLEYLNVWSINLSNNQLVDITPLGKNRKIRELNISNNKIKDISCFANNNLFLWGEINFSNNQIEDISSIKTWPVMRCHGWGKTGEGEPNTREISINLSGNNIREITPVKDFVHIRKLNLSNNNIDNIEPLASYNFNCSKDYETGEIWECLEAFEGILLNNNYINTATAANKKAIELFQKKNVRLQLDNQKQRDVATIFTDVKKADWYYTAVNYNYNNNMIKGLNATTFAPNNTLTRGMLVTILHRMEGSPYVSGLSKFKDVQNTSEYYYVAVKWATQNNIVSGYNNGNFGPNDNITREQLAVILNKYCKYKGKYKAQANILNQFKDASKISDFAKWEMQWATGVGVITGSNGNLNPQGTATRAEAASMLFKYCSNVK